MAEREPTDSDLLNDAYAEAEPEAPPIEQETPEPPEAEAAETPGVEETAQEPETPAEPEEPEKEREGAIPTWRLREEAEAKRAEKERADKLEQELAQLRQQNQQFQSQIQQNNQPQQPEIDPYEDPKGWQKQQNDTFEQRLLNERLNMSEGMARLHFGDETVDTALQWVQTLPMHERQAILQSRNPYGDLVNRKRQADTLAEIGTDPKAYRDKVLEEAMQDQDFVKRVMESAKSGAEGRPEQHVTKLPPSLNRQQGAANAKADAGTEVQPMSDAELLADAMRR